MSKSDDQNTIHQKPWLVRTTEHITKILRNIVYTFILLFVLIIILSNVGRYLISGGGPKTEPGFIESKTIETPVVEVHPAVNRAELDEEVRKSLSMAREKAEEFADNELKTWTEDLKVRLDDSFLPWYFGYWQTQWTGLKSLYYSGLDYVWNEKPQAAEKITETIQQEFAARVLRPEISQKRLERITHETIKVYLVVPEKPSPHLLSR